MSNPFMKREEKARKSNRHGRVAEKNAMKILGAQQTRGSGSVEGHKSDGFTQNFRFENKATIHESFSLKLEVLNKIRKEAMESGRYPVLSFSFTDGAGKSKPEGDFVVLPRWVFEFMMEGFGK